MAEQDDGGSGTTTQNCVFVTRNGLSFVTTGFLYHGVKT